MKKLVSCVFLFLALILLQACDNSANSDVQKNSEKQIHKGHYIYGHEVNTFQPCGQKMVFWVNGSNEVLNTLQQKYKSYTLLPYEEVFVELTGDFVGKASDGFAMDYDGQFLVVTLLKMSKKFKDDCH